MSSFTAGESDVMTILWEHGSQKPSEIQTRHPRHIKNAALRFQLKVLLEKGHISRRKTGKAYYYRAITHRKGAFRKMARRMAESYCQGSTAGLIAELIKTEKLSEEEIIELRRLVGDQRKGGTRKKEVKQP